MRVAHRPRQAIRIADDALTLLASQREAATYAVRVAEQADRRERYATMRTEETALWARVEELRLPLGKSTGATAAIPAAAYRCARAWIGAGRALIDVFIASRNERGESKANPLTTGQRWHNAPR